MDTLGRAAIPFDTNVPSPLLVTTRGTGALSCATHLLISYSDISSYFFNFLFLSLVFFYTKPLVFSFSFVHLAAIFTLILLLQVSLVRSGFTEARKMFTGNY